MICHGIPDSRPLADGDIVNLDITICLDGMHGDCSATFLVGEVDEAGRRLVRVARECLERGISAVKPGRPISDIGRAIEPHAAASGFGVVRSYCGHGIGETFHTSLQIPHHVDPRARRDHGAGADLHHRADDHRGALGRRASGTTAGRRSPPTGCAPPSSSTPCWSPPTGAEILTLE